MQPSTPEKTPRLELAKRKNDPFGIPRPEPEGTAVPLRTSVYFELALVDAPAEDSIDPDSVRVTLTAGRGKPKEVLKPGGSSAPVSLASSLRAERACATASRFTWR